MPLAQSISNDSAPNQNQNRTSVSISLHRGTSAVSKCTDMESAQNMRALARFSEDPLRSSGFTNDLLAAPFLNVKSRITNFRAALGSPSKPDKLKASTC